MLIINLHDYFGMHSIHAWVNYMYIIISLTQAWIECIPER